MSNRPPRNPQTGIHIGGNADVDGKNIAGHDVFCVDGDYHYHSSKADSPYVAAVCVSVDKFLRELPVYSRLFFGSPEGEEIPIEFQEELEQRPYLLQRPPVIEERLILRIDTSSLRTALSSTVAAFGREALSDGAWKQLNVYFQSEQKLLLHNVAISGRSGKNLAATAGIGTGLVASVGTISTLGGAIGTGIIAAPATLGLSLLAPIVGILGGELLRNRLKSNAHCENHERVSAFRRESISSIQSCRRQIIRAILVFTKEPAK